MTTASEIVGWVIILGFMGLVWLQARLIDRLIADKGDLIRQIKESSLGWQRCLSAVVEEYDPERAEEIRQAFAKAYADVALQSCIPPRKGCRK